jgi:undecaprenyl-diphosphatase
MPTYELHKGASKKASARPRPKHWAQLVASLVIGLGLLVFGAFVASHNHLQGLGGSVFHAINNLPGTLATAANYVTIGLSLYALAVAVVIALTFKKWRLAWRFFLASAGSYVIAEIVKKIVHEPRPGGLLAHGSFHLRAMETNAGFPSGHVAVTAGLALTVWFLLPPKWRWLCVVWILAVALSRLYLGVHSPVDVLGGFAVGLLVVAVIRLLPKVVARPLQLDDQSEEYNPDK